MNKNYLYLILFIIISIFLVYFSQLPTSSLTNSDKSTIDRANCVADDCLQVEGLEYPAGTLPDPVKIALDKALDDEYKAHTTYEVVIAKLGSARPFSMIIGAEEQHIAQLKALYTKYGLSPTPNNYLGKLSSPSTLAEACDVGVSAEIANGALYRDELLPAVTQYPDITQVFTNLMNASLQKHLSAFSRCSIR